jgi:hypothetical protein
VSHLFDSPLCEFLIDSVILGKQDVKGLGGTAGGLLNRLFCVGLRRLVFDSVESRSEMKSASAARRALHPNSPVHQTCQLGADGKPDTGTARTLGRSISVEREETLWGINLWVRGPQHL